MELKLVLEDLGCLVEKEGWVQSLLVVGKSGSGKSTAVKECLSSKNWVEVDSLEGWSSSVRRHGGFTAFEEMDVFLRRKILCEKRPRFVVIENGNIWLSRKGTEVRLVLTLLEIMHCWKGFVLVIVVEERNSLHTLLRNHSFSAEFDMPSLGENDRLRIFREELRTSNLPEGLIASFCQGWTPADIVFVCNKVKSGQGALGNLLQEHNPPRLRFKRSVTIPDTTWESIGGLSETKQTLREMIVWPHLHRDLFQEFGLDTPSGGILLYGPPGTGKTLLASAIASEMGARFLSVSISDVVKGLVGASERAIAEIFKQARQNVPCIIYFDEMQAVFGRRATAGEVGRKMVSQLLLEMDDLPGGLILIGSTNVPEAIDPALFRPGRFDRKLEIPLPDSITRIKILEGKLAGMKVGDDVNAAAVERLVENLKFSGAELHSLCEKAGIEAIKEINAEKICLRHFSKALAHGEIKRT